MRLSSCYREWCSRCHGQPATLLCRRRSRMEQEEAKKISRALVTIPAFHKRIRERAEMIQNPHRYRLAMQGFSWR